MGMLDLFPEDEPWLREQMRKLGYAPDDATRDPAIPQGVGNTVAAAVLAYRHHDGANQLGDEIGSDKTPYSDYTFYRPANSPDRVLDPDRWQPLPFDDGKGKKVYPEFSLLIGIGSNHSGSAEVIAFVRRRLPRWARRSSRKRWTR